MQLTQKDYLLTHGGLGNYSSGKELEDYSIEELVWDRADYETQYFDDVIILLLTAAAISREAGWLPYALIRVRNFTRHKPSG